MKKAHFDLDDNIYNRSNHSTTKALVGTIGLFDGPQDQDPSSKKNPRKEMIPPMAVCVGSVDHVTAPPSTTQDQDYLPVAQSVTVVNNQGLDEENAAVATATVEVECFDVLDAGTSNLTDDSFNTASVQSFVTPENERANMSRLEQIQSIHHSKHHNDGHDLNNTGAMQTRCWHDDRQTQEDHTTRCTWFDGNGYPTNTTTTITGEELLSRLKKQRKKATARSGIVGGLVGFLFLGPIGALGIGVGSAVMTKHRLKRREKTLRNQLEGRLNHPLPVISNGCGFGGGGGRHCPHQR